MSEDNTDGLRPDAQLVAAGATLIEVTHRGMRAMSLQKPRDLESVLVSIVAEIDQVQAWAERGFYEFKKGGEIITGPSVQLTRMVARNFGNCHVRSYLYGTSGRDGFETYQMSGVFIDFETNYMIERMYTVSPQKWRGGQYVQIEGEDLMNEVMIGASCAERNAVVAAVPDWIMESVYKKCRTLAADSTRKTMSAVLQWFQEHGVSRPALERAIGGDLDKLDDGQLATLRGLKNALRDREIKARDIGGQDEEQPEEDAAATVEEVIKGGATTTGGRTAGEVKPEAEPADETVEPESEEPATEAGDDDSDDDGWY